MSNTIINLERQLEKEAAASYYIGRYYFKVNTGNAKSSFGLSQGENITLEMQRNLQTANLIPMFHEYIHYIHDISTAIGSMALHLDISLKAIFSNYFNHDIKSCENNGIDLTDTIRLGHFAAFHNSMEALNGSIAQGVTILKINSVKNVRAILSLHNGTELQEYPFEVPDIEVELFENNNYHTSHLIFGRFFILEGLAYELDRQIEKQLSGSEQIKDDLKLTEYTFMRLLANYIYPGIPVEAYLTAASLSLSFHDCGMKFIKFLNRFKTLSDERKTVNEITRMLKEETSAYLFERLEVFYESMDELPGIFAGRVQLNEAFSIIVRQVKNGYLARAENPTFEVDYILEGRFIELLNVIPICDYMYVFTDPNEYNRDFLGTASYTQEESFALKLLIVLDHYQKAHGLKSTLALEKKSSVRCPFYTVCDLQLRKDHETICNSRPWRMFEISSKTDNQYCWYGNGVGESKGLAQYHS